MNITGTTQLFLIIGDPVSQVQAPRVINEVFRQCAIDAVLAPAWVSGSDISRFIPAVFAIKNMGGLFVTIPHKSSVVAALDRCDRFGRVAGAVNAIRCADDGVLEGGFFDGIGFVRSLDYYGIAYRGRRVLILGGGGSASAIAASLADGGTGHIGLYDPAPGKAAQVAERIGSEFGCSVEAAASNDAAGFDLVVNATPIGMEADDPLPFDVERLERWAAVVDILMKNQPTPLVRAVRARGLRAEPGFEMFIQQTPAYLEFFGFPEAAARVKTDASALRALIYPKELL